MKIDKIRFWDNERKIMLTSRVSCVTAFRNYLEVSSQPGFSSIDTYAQKEKYTPMIATGMVDKFCSEIWESDIVLYKPDGYSTSIEFEVVYDECNACFGLFERKKGNYNSYFIQQDVMPLFGCPPGDIEIIGNIYNC